MLHLQKNPSLGSKCVIFLDLSHWQIFFFSILFFGLGDSYFSLNMGHLKILSWISFCFLWHYHYIMRF